MDRRHFMQHVAGASAVMLPSTSFIQNLRAAETNLKKANKSLIIFWMGGGPSHMDLWDLKPGAQTGGEFKISKPPHQASKSAKYFLLSLPSSNTLLLFVHSLPTKVATSAAPC